LASPLLSGAQSDGVVSPGRVASNCPRFGVAIGGMNGIILALPLAAGRLPVARVFGGINGQEGMTIRRGHCDVGVLHLCMPRADAYATLWCGLLRHDRRNVERGR